MNSFKTLKAIQPEYNASHRIPNTYVNEKETNTLRVSVNTEFSCIQAAVVNSDLTISLGFELLLSIRAIWKQIRDEIPDRSVCLSLSYALPTAM